MNNELRVRFELLERLILSFRQVLTGGEEGEKTLVRKGGRYTEALMVQERYAEGPVSDSLTSYTRGHCVCFEIVRTAAI